MKILGVTLVIFVCLVGYGFRWYSKVMREEAFIKYVHPMVNDAVRMAPLSDTHTMTYEKFKHMHLEACKATNDLLAMSKDKPIDPFSDGECLKLMDKTRPIVTELKLKPPEPVREVAAVTGLQFPANSSEALAKVKASLNLPSEQLSVLERTIGSAVFSEIWFGAQDEGGNLKEGCLVLLLRKSGEPNEIWFQFTDQIRCEPLFVSSMAVLAGQTKNWNEAYANLWLNDFAPKPEAPVPSKTDFTSKSGSEVVVRGATHTLRFKFNN